MKRKTGKMTFSSQVLELASTEAVETSGSCGCSHEFADESGEEPAEDVPAPRELEPSPGAVAEWRGILAVEGILTGDARLLEDGSMRWENLPLSFRWTAKDSGAHDGAEVVGMIQSIERGEGGVLEASGLFDLSTSVGVDAYLQAKNGFTRGISVDLDDVSFEIRVAADLLESDEEILVDGEDGPEEPEVDEDGRVKVIEIAADAEVRVVTAGRIRAATMVSIPAFIEAMISEVGDPYQIESGALVASGVEAPPMEWFQNPSLPGPTPLTVTDEGRVLGHLALWDTCHTGFSPGKCVTPPRSSTNYQYFMLGVTRTDRGDVPTGKITLNTTHASGDLTAAVAAAHYEDTGAVVADVSVGEDQFGIWYSGSLRPGVSETQVRALRAAPLSGDWRRIGSSLELVAALAVNMPGYPIPRPAGLVASGQISSLVAAGMVRPAPIGEGEFSPGDLETLRQVIGERKAKEQALRVEKAAALRDRAMSAKNHRKVEAFAKSQRKEKI